MSDEKLKKGPPKDIGMFTSSHMHEVLGLPSLEEARNHARKIVEASSARSHNKAKAHSMIDGSRNQKHLAGGMANFMLAAEGQKVIKDDSDTLSLTKNDLGQWQIETLEKQNSIVSNPVVTSIKNAFGGGTTPTTPTPTASPSPVVTPTPVGGLGASISASIGRRLGKDDQAHKLASPEDKAHDVVETKLKALKEKLKEVKSASGKERLKSHVKSAEKNPRSAKNKNKTKMSKAEKQNGDESSKKKIAVLGGGTSKPKFTSSPAATGRAKVREMGRTTSGRSIMSNFNADSHSGFSAKDHEEAARVHLRAASDLETRGANPDLIDQHRSMHEKHWQKMLELKEKENPLRRG